MVDRELVRKLFLLDCNMSNVSISSALAFEIARNDPTDANIRTYAILAQADAFSKKASDGEVPNDLIELNNVTYARVESRMRSLNLERGFLNSSWFLRARDLVHQVLSPLARVEDEVWSLCRFGPGVTCCTSGPRGRYLLEKIGGAQTITRECIPIFLEVVERYYPSWKDNLVKTSSVKVVAGNRTAYVPKDIRKCRRIAIEPSCNLFLQMGVGNWIAQRLKLFGVDIYDQTINRSLAQKGSLDRSVATIDLSDASDSISIELVRSLVPPDWFHLMDRIRSKVSLDGYRFEKFSSQGNAFTFPLETLIFWAITKSVSSFCSVYGDDIVCDSESYHRVTEAISEAGFTANEEKSFYECFFRESCGGDFIKGVDVRPVFYKETCRRPSDVAKLHNQLINRWGWNLPHVRSYLRSLVRKPLFGPQYYWSTCKDRPWMNVQIQDLEGYFFDEDELSWSRKRWDSQPIRVNWYTLHSAGTRMLAFLYSMRNIEDVSSLRRYVLSPNRARFVPVSGRR